MPGMHLARGIDQLEPVGQWRLAVAWAARGPLGAAGAQVLRAAEAVIDGRRGALGELKARLDWHASHRKDQPWQVAVNHVYRAASTQHPTPPTTRVVRVAELAGMPVDDMWADIIAAGAARYCNNPRTLECAARLGPGWDGTLSALYETAHLLVEGRRGPCF